MDLFSNLAKFVPFRNVLFLDNSYAKVSKNRLNLVPKTHYGRHLSFRSEMIVSFPKNQKLRNSDGRVLSTDSESFHVGTRRRHVTTSPRRRFVIRHRPISTNLRRHYDVADWSKMTNKC